jgi:hypothetical protein
VGVVGSVVTQIISGLTVGEQVVLADLSTPLPTNNTGTIVRGLTTGGGGGFGGARTGGGGGGAG